MDFSIKKALGKNIPNITHQTHTYSFSNEEARKVTGVVQRDKMAKILKNWAKQGLLIQIVPPPGYFKGTKYKLPDSPEVKK